MDFLCTTDAHLQPSMSVVLEGLSIHKKSSLHTATLTSRVLGGKKMRLLKWSWLKIQESHFALGKAVHK